MKISNQSSWQQKKIPSYSDKYLHRWQVKVLTLTGAGHMHFPLPLIKASVHTLEKSCFIWLALSQCELQYQELKSRSAGIDSSKTTHPPTKRTHFLFTQNNISFGFVWGFFGCFFVCITIIHTLSSPFLFNLYLSLKLSVLKIVCLL